jgi:hypothetical protein
MCSPHFPPLRAHPKLYLGPDWNSRGEGAFRRQVHYVITDRLEPLLKAAGSSLEHSLNARSGADPRGEPPRITVLPDSPMPKNLDPHNIAARLSKQNHPLLEELEKRSIFRSENALPHRM